MFSIRPTCSLSLWYTHCSRRSGRYTPASAARFSCGPLSSAWKWHPGQSWNSCCGKDPWSQETFHTPFYSASVRYFATRPFAFQKPSRQRPERYLWEMKIAGSNRWPLDCQSLTFSGVCIMYSFFKKYGRKIQTKTEKIFLYFLSLSRNPVCSWVQTGFLDRLKSISVTYFEWLRLIRIAQELEVW